MLIRNHKDLGKSLYLVICFTIFLQTGSGGECKGIKKKKRSGRIRKNRLKIEDLYKAHRLMVKAISKHSCHIAKERVLLHDVSK